MAAFDKFAGVDENFNFPPEVARQIYNSPEGAGKFLKGDPGEKGDPGGFTTPITLPVNTNLDTVKTGGLYQFNALVSTGNNLPPELNQNYGMMYVTATDGGVRITQTIYPTASGQGGKLFYIRHMVSSVWSSWRACVTSRVDLTAGRAIYQYDPSNNRDQLMYGDTGWRDITPLFSGVLGTTVSPGSDYGVHMRRINYSVHWRIKANTIGTGDGTSTVIPLGFRSDGTYLGEFSVVRNSNLRGQMQLSQGAQGWLVMPSGLASLSRIAGLITTFTDDPWPTTLPGTAIGSIPNL